MSLYSDINTSKEEHYSKVYDIDAVWQSFSNFMKTRKRQRFFRPELGNSLSKDLLFEIAEEDAIYYALSTTTRELSMWDPRINVNFGRCSASINYEKQSVEMKIVFSVVGFEDKIITKSLTL